MRPPLSRDFSTIVARAARIHIAETPASNLYLNPAVIRAGAIFAPEHDRIIVAQDSVVAFVDDEPTKNWGHKCRYLMHDPASGRIIQEAHALMPPSFSFGRDFRAVHVGTPALTAVDHPVLTVPTLPPWIFRNPSQWYAILYAGLSNNRHLNDIEFLYRTLTHSYGVPKANITVLNYDGTLQYNNWDWTPHVGSIGNWPGDNTPYQAKIDGAGTKAALLGAIATVGAKLKADDNLLIHTNNHGGRSGNVSTLCSHDGPVTLPADFGGALAKLPKYHGLMVMMEQCFSGGFIDTVIANSTANCTSIATAVDAVTSSDGGTNFDPYALAWIKAMAGTTESGGTLSPMPAQDTSHHVSAQSAFDWSKTRGGIHDNPQFKQNMACGGALTLAPAKSGIVVIPPIWKHLWPWEILPDPSPEQIRTLGDHIAVEASAGRIIAGAAGIAAARTRIAALAGGIR